MGDELLGAVRRCWTSLWSARAIAYRKRGALHHERAAVAVVVQRLVPAEVSGVLFSANPVTGARHELVINAALGLGEAVVGGLTTPDSFILDHATLTVLERQTGRQDGDHSDGAGHDRASARPGSSCPPDVERCAASAIGRNGACHRAPLR